VPSSATMVVASSVRMAVLVMTNPPETIALVSGQERPARATVPAATSNYATARQGEALARGFRGDLRDAIWLSVAFGCAASDYHHSVADHRPRLMPADLARCNISVAVRRRGLFF